MKTLYLIISLILLATMAEAQYFLDSETHGLLIGDTQKTMLSDYVNEGKSGRNVIWDFSGMTCNGAHYASVVQLSETPYTEAFPDANTVIAEHGNFFFYSTDEEKSDFLGYSTRDLIIKYEKPITKMKFPLKYNDKFEGEYTGKTVISTIKGEYTVEADGYGTIMMPNGGIIENAIRVKSYDRYVESACNTIEVETEKYLWYAEGYRYPVVVVIKRNVYPAGKEPIKRRYTVYNDNIAAPLVKKTTTELDIIKKIDVSYKIYPNPFSDRATISYTLDVDREVQIEIFDGIGQSIEVFQNKKQTPGTHSYEFMPEKHNLAPGTYFVKLMFDERVYLEKIINQGF